MAAKITVQEAKQKISEFWSSLLKNIDFGEGIETKEHIAFSVEIDESGKLNIAPYHLPDDIIITKGNSYTPAMRSNFSLSEAEEQFNLKGNAYTLPASAPPPPPSSSGKRKINISDGEVDNVS